MLFWSTYATSVLSLLSGLLIAQSVCGQQLSLPKTDGCFRLPPELQKFHVQGEAVVLRCSSLERVLHKYFFQDKVEYVITKGNSPRGIETEQMEDGRVLRRERQLWLLPAHTSDSGEYSCFYRNDTLCVTGSITLEVYETKQTGMEKLSYPINSRVGQDVSIQCPQLSDFNWTDEIMWYKDSSVTGLPVGSGCYHRLSRDKIRISDVSHADQGHYTCQLSVHVNNLHYKVSRTIKLNVKVPEPGPNTEPSGRNSDPTVTANPNPTHSTVEYSAVQGPTILAPVNGTIFESPLGSSLEISCLVSTGNQSADATVVTWLVNDQSVESSYLGRRALIKKRVITVSGRNYAEVKLSILKMFQEDVRAVLKCVTRYRGGRQEVIAQLKVKDSTITWLTMVVVGSVCFLTVVSVFVYLLLKPRGKADYILARQNSTFSSSLSSAS
ncbi:hypothetical protein DPEC_G00048350 [Dallia pectoralis]|uniref:Uncharacterized protein n=1 Tax=Dallia pectoralis TaxID=75939 RepID=A0ACC2HAJ6_DALPE|nr:hypothetical protein DPEC_G00048350 [Dallia pectoralis]